jgi:hypothetical protein
VNVEGRRAVFEAITLDGRSIEKVEALGAN